MVMNPSPFILDGGLATELEASGFQLHGDPLWSARVLHTAPQAIKDVHYRFLLSGSDVITTATYQASVEGLVKHLGVQPEEARLRLMTAVQLAREAIQEFKSNWPLSDRREPLVAGSVGPYGAFLHDGSEYSGNYEDKMTVELKDWHRPQIQCLVNAGSDLVAMETIPSLKEAEALLEVIKEFPETKAWLSFSCKDSHRIACGRSFSEAVQLASRCTQLVAVGLNCCTASLVTPLLQSARAHKRADLSWVVWKTQSRTSFAKQSLEWKEEGALWIGGCCHVSPSDIAELKQELHSQP
ncbi:hypothetical protein DNTS_003469 [Danionella cerebrum]|uniref:Hcy-binding domain-containing protein n=1 Tax=Danionella cerebrum TaxID=2873325 RepID=A0A553QH90_9TELE|nr:hypothetical protein DNTS_003469 [Danionella translucida]